MANVKLSELPAIDTVANGDTFPITDVSASNGSKKATTAQIIAAIPSSSGSSPGLMSASDKNKLDAATSSATNSAIVQRDSSGNAAVNILTAAKVTVTGVPSASTDATNKSYVDSLASGLTIKAAVDVATTANVTLSGGAPSVVDGITLTVGARVLVKDQSDASQNGIYSVTTVGSGSNGTWARSSDADTSGELPTGSYVFVNGGTLRASSSWVMNTPGPITLGTTLLTWVLFSDIGSIPASDITGSIVGSQIANGAITTAKFALGITPVEIVSAMPTTGNFQGRMVFLTTVDGSFAANKIYRWTSTTTSGTTFWTAAVPSVDITGALTDAQIADLAAAKLTGQITSTQITDGSISTPKLAAGSVTTAKLVANVITSNELASDSVTAAKIFAGSVTTSKLAAGAVTANELAANSIIVGKVAAGAIGASEIAAGAINASKIAAGTITSSQIAANTITAGNILAGTITSSQIAANTITAGNLNVSTLSAISANLGTVTAGSITSSTSIDVGSSTQRVQISTSGLSIAAGRINLAGDGTNPFIKVFGSGGFASDYITINGSNGGVAPFLQANSGGPKVTISPGGITSSSTIVALSGCVATISSGATLNGPGDINLFGAHGSALSIVCGEDPTGGTPQGWLVLQVNGRAVKVAFEV